MNVGFATSAIRPLYPQLLTWRGGTNGAMGHDRCGRGGSLGPLLDAQLICRNALAGQTLFRPRRDRHRAQDVAGRVVG
jgi:hypothetical protein